MDVTDWIADPDPEPIQQHIPKTIKEMLDSNGLIPMDGIIPISWIQKSNIQLYKVLTPSMKHYNFQYQVGLNLLDEKFVAAGDHVAGGFYVTDTPEQWIGRIGMVTQWKVKIARVSLPNDTKIYVARTNRKQTQLKVDKLILHDPIEWFDEKMTIHKLNPFQLLSDEDMLVAICHFPKLSLQDIILNDALADCLMILHRPWTDLPRCFRTISRARYAIQLGASLKDMDFEITDHGAMEFWIDTVKKNPNELKFVPLEYRSYVNDEARSM